MTRATAEWHAPQTERFTTTTYCGKVLEGAIEGTSDEKAEREGRCSACATRLAARAKKTAVKKTVRKPTPKGRSGKTPVAKRPVGRSRRGRA